MIYMFSLDTALSLNLPLPDFLKRVARQWLMRKVSPTRDSEKSGSAVVDEELLSADSVYKLRLGPDRCAGCSAESPDCDIEPCFGDINKNENLFG